MFSSHQPSPVSMSEEVPQILIPPSSPRRSLALRRPRSQSPGQCRSSAPGTPSACPTTPTMSVGPEGSEADLGRRFSDISSCASYPPSTPLGHYTHNPYAFEDDEELPAAATVPQCQSYPRAREDAPAAVAPFCHNPYGFGPTDYPMERPSAPGAARAASASAAASAAPAAVAGSAVVAGAGEGVVGVVPGGSQRRRRAALQALQAVGRPLAQLGVPGVVAPFSPMSGGCSHSDSCCGLSTAGSPCCPSETSGTMSPVPFEPLKTIRAKKPDFSHVLCRDYVKGKCNERRWKCKYWHPPLEQLQELQVQMQLQVQGQVSQQ